MSSTDTSTDRPWNIYLRLSDFRDDSDGFAGRERRLRASVARLGGTVAEPPVIENDLRPAANGRARPASAFKRRKITLPSGRTELRVYRPGFRKVIDDLAAGRANVMCEDLDRAARDPRDLEDLVDACAASRLSARSLSGSLTLTQGGTDSEITMARVMVTMANKASRDIARRVSAKRADLAAAGSYGGGRRPFGYRPDPAAPKYRKRLVIIPAEAAEVEKAADAVMARVSLAAIARDWRERGVPSVTGAAWTPATVRDVLCKPATAGLIVTRQDGRQVLCDAPWPAILERDRWEALVAVLTDPGRRTTTGNEPRHLCSLWARCHCDAPVRAGGGSGGKSYVCTSGHSHLRRDSAKTDVLVAEYVIARLERDDAADLLRPPARPGIDTAALRAESARLAERRKVLVRANVAGDLDDTDLAEGVKEIKRRQAVIDAQLAEVTEPDPLAEFRGQPEPRAVWESLPLPRKRAVAQGLTRVTFLPATLRGPKFDEHSVQIGPASPGVA